MFIVPITINSYHFDHFKHKDALVVQVLHLFVERIHNQLIDVVPVEALKSKMIRNGNGMFISTANKNWLIFSLLPNIETLNYSLNSSTKGKLLIDGVRNPIDQPRVDGRRQNIPSIACLIGRVASAFS